MASTIKDISRMTGLSLATISKYLNGGNLLPENHDSIKKAIEELDFRVNSFARGLKTSKSNMIGIVIPMITNMYATSLIAKIESILRKHNYATLVCDCGSDPKIEKENIEFLISKSVDGIINIPISRTGDHLETAKALNIPVVLIEIKFDKYNFDSVMINDTDISKKATSYLIGCGHKNIGYITGPMDTLIAQDRYIGYMQAHTENGLVFQNRLVVNGEFNAENTYEAVTKFLIGNKDVTAIFVTEPEMTLGSLLAINDLDIKIPSDLSFIGFDNLRISNIYKPKLTTVSQPIDKIAETATEIMLDRISRKSPPDQIIRKLDATLIYGDSVVVI
jgi:LacI family transcriptional regulator